MASIQKRPDGRYRARYRDAGGSEHARHFGRKIDAQQWLDEVTASIVTGQYVNPKAGRVTLTEYAGQWEAAQVGSQATARIVDNALRLHILPVLGTRPVASLRRSDVQGLMKRLSSELAPNSIKAVYNVLSRVTGSAVLDRVIASSPCHRIQLPAVADHEVVPLTARQVQERAAVMPSEYRAAVIMLAGSGLRIGELLGLRVADVDFLRRTVRVERQRLQEGRIGPPKTPKSVRTVPIGQVVVDGLAAHLVAHPSEEWLFTDGSEWLGYRRWRTVWNAGHATLQAAEDQAAGRESRDRLVVPKYGTHDLRHFFASALIAGGASVKQVQAVLGHSSAVVTLRVYAHLWPGDEDRTRAIIDATLDGLRTVHGPGDLEAGSAAGQRG